MIFDGAWLPRQRSAGDGGERENSKLKQGRPRRTLSFNGIPNNGHARRDKRGGRQNGRTDELVPLDRIPAATEMLLSVLNAPPAEVHRIMMEIRKGWLGCKPGEILGAFRRLRNGRGDARGKHAIWTGEDIEILRAGYAEEPVAARRARKELLGRHPDWNRSVLDYQASKLGLTNHRPRAGQWPEIEHKQLLWGAGEISVRDFAAQFGRSTASIRTRLCWYGAYGKVREDKHYSRRQAAAIFGVAHTTVRRWIAVGLLHTSRNRDGYGTTYLTRAAIEAFCMQHPERLNPQSRAAEVLERLREE